MKDRLSLDISSETEVPNMIKSEVRPMSEEAIAEDSNLSDNKYFKENLLELLQNLIIYTLALKLMIVSHVNLIKKFLVTHSSSVFLQKQQSSTNR